MKALSGNEPVYGYLKISPDNIFKIVIMNTNENILIPITQEEYNTGKA